MSPQPLLLVRAERVAITLRPHRWRLFGAALFLFFVPVLYALTTSLARPLPGFLRVAAISWTLAWWVWSVFLLFVLVSALATRLICPTSLSPPAGSSLT